MLNKKIYWIIAAIALLLIIVFIYTSKQQKTATVVTDIFNQPTEKQEADLKDVVTDSGISKWGFAATDSGICYLTDNLTLKYFDLTTNKSEVAFSPSSEFSAAKVLATTSSCAVMYYGDINSLYIYDASKQIKKINLAAESINQNNNLYTVDLDNKKIILDSNGNSLKEIGNSDGLIYKIAPITIDKYFTVDSYNPEDPIGNLRLVDSGKERFKLKVESVTSLFSNVSRALEIFQNGTINTANLVKDNGAIVKSIDFVDSDLVFPTKDGFYFVTQPRGIESQNRDGNSIGFISNNGQITNVLFETGTNYSFSSVSLRNNILYVANHDTIYKLNI